MNVTNEAWHRGLKTMSETLLDTADSYLKEKGE